MKELKFIANKTDKSVVRNQAYGGKEFNTRERHNERKNESYGNGDIDPARSNMNVHFRRVLSADGSPETYEQTFNRLLSEGAIVKRGLKPDAKVFDEMIFDVNSSYFENHGGYEYAKSFFEEAYKQAVQEVGGEQFILSAVLHADERHKALSEELGRDVYHYHLHVVYVPIVPKELYFKKNNKNSELAGKLKEVINQISNSKKWPIKLPVEKNGKHFFVNSYSLLQDRFYEHMREAGFVGFERGERGSTAEHLSDTEFKTKQEKERLAAATAEVEQKQKTSAALDTAIENKQQASSQLDEKNEAKKKKLAEQEQKLVVAKHDAATFADIDRMSEKKTLGGNVSLSSSDWNTVSGLAKEGIKIKGIISTLKEKISALLSKIAGLEKRLAGYEGKGVTDTMQYYTARERAPRRMAKMVADIMRQPPERQAPVQNQQRKKSIGEDR